MDQQEFLRIEFEKNKSIIESELIHLSKDNIEIDIRLNSEIKQIQIDGCSIDTNLLLGINNAIMESKKIFELKWMTYLSEYGIKF